VDYLRGSARIFTTGICVAVITTVANIRLKRREVDMGISRNKRREAIRAKEGNYRPAKGESRKDESDPDQANQRDYRHALSRNDAEAASGLWN
jgi:hypothetical protein